MPAVSAPLAALLLCAAAQGGTLQILVPSERWSSFEGVSAVAFRDMSGDGIADITTIASRPSSRPSERTPRSRDPDGSAEPGPHAAVTAPRVSGEDSVALLPRESPCPTTCPHES